MMVEDKWAGCIGGTIHRVSSAPCDQPTHPPIPLSLDNRHDDDNDDNDDNDDDDDDVDDDNAETSLLPNSCLAK